MIVGTAPAAAATHLFPRARDARRLYVVRQYDIPVIKGAENTAGVPALMSLWGATNEQVILDSEFTYSVQPDKIEIVADKYGQTGRNYELTWKAPNADRISVTQKLVVEITCRNALGTAAKLPYPKEVQDRLAALLARSEFINGENEKVAALGKAIAKRAVYAEDAVELACDWVNDNIAFKSGSPGASDTVLASGQGNCFGMANLVCAVLRSIGIPADTVHATFIGGGGHAYLEAYFPDAGWVFYDVSNATRGFKSLDCLVTTGGGFYVRNAQGLKGHQGTFLTVKDAGAYQEDDRLVGPPLRAGPRKTNVQGVRVFHRAPPAKMKVRHLALCQLLKDLSIPPGKREYVNPLAKATAPEPKPAEKPAPPVAPKPAEKPKPAPRPAESPAARQLKVARMYLGAGLAEKGATMLQGIVREFPDSKEAAEAKKLLADLGRSK
jgi:hypothetical protein